MFSLIVDPETVGLVESRPVVVCATDVEDLLMSWLNELIYLHETDGLVLREFEVGKFDAVSAELEATVRGEAYDPERHQLELGIKACTFNGLAVVEGPPARVTVYFDV
jgi:SHS2 domain-containing protein